MLMGMVLAGSEELWAKPDQPCTTNQGERSHDARPCLKHTAAESTHVEPHLANVRQLTFGGKNAEAYFSFDGDKLIFQSTNEPGKGAVHECYQMYIMDLDGSNIQRVSTGVGGTTCGYFYPGGRRVLYSSTHLQGPRCPPQPPRGERYRWALDDYDIFSARVDGQQIQRLTNSPRYDAEATVSPDGKTMVFTSMRGGDLDLYAMNLDGTHVRQLTHEVGYDGGAFFSADSRRIVYRASHPQDQTALEYYQELLAQDLVEPSHLELFVMNADGSERRQVTSNGAANFAPFFHPDGRRIIFSSNVSPEATSKESRPSFHLHLINDDGTGLEQVTVSGNFNSFPMFSPDGTRLVWASDRNVSKRGEFNIFLADWVP